MLLTPALCLPPEAPSLADAVSQAVRDGVAAGELVPETTYSVAVTRTPQRTKISVGSNPWSPRPRTHNIATICERYGGGGHAVVGAVSYSPDEVERARATAREIIAELSNDFRE